METIDNEVREGLESIQEESLEAKAELEDVSEEVTETVEEITEAAEETVTEAADETTQAADEAQAVAEETIETAQESAAEVIEEAENAAQELIETAEETEEAVNEAEIIAEEAAAESETAAEEIAQTAEETVSEVSEGADTLLEEAAAETAAESEGAIEETIIESEQAEEPAEKETIEEIAETAEEKAFVNEAPPAKAAKGSLLKDKRVIIGAVLLALAIALAFIIPAYKKSQTYKLGIEKLHNGEYQEAVDTLAEIEGYKDADQYSAYASGLKAFYDGDLDIARSDLEESGGLEDAGLYTSYIDGVQSMEEGYDASSYQFAADSFTAAGELLDSADMAVYTQAVSDFIQGNTEAAGAAFRTVVSDNAIPSEYVDTAKNVVLYLDSVAKFDSDDYSVKDDFNTVAANDDGLIGGIASEYVYYIEGKELYDEKHYYKASRKFDYCFDIKDAEELYNSCIQERPATGIVYNKNKSSAVSVKIYDNSDGDDLFVKFYDSNDKLVETLYIRDGKNGTAKIANGKHRMALASGDGNEWYGTKDMFGSNGRYQRLLIDGDKEYYNFQKNYEYTLKFNVKDGNVSSKYTDFEDF